MEGDFKALAEHPKFKEILISFIAFRFNRRVAKDAIISLVADITKKKLTSIDVLVMLKELYSSSELTPEKIKHDKSKKMPLRASQEVQLRASQEVQLRASQETPLSYSDARIAARLREIEPLSGYISSIRVRKYLDIGCGDGTITAAIGHKLGLGKEDIIGADIAAWAGHSHQSEVSGDITFTLIKDPYAIDMPDGSVDLITIFMTMHHVKEDVIPATMLDIARVLSSNGIILLREHDSPNKFYDSLINIEHALFETVIEGLVKPEDFQRTYYGRYKMRRDWICLFQMYGFEPIGASISSPLGTRHFYQMFRKTVGTETIETKSAPRLAEDARRLGINVPKAVNTEQLKRAIVAGRRGQN